MARDTRFLRNRNGTWWIDVRIPAKSGIVFPNGRLRMSLRTTSIEAAARIRDQTIIPLLATVAKKDILEELLRQICKADDESRQHVAQLSALCEVQQVAGIRSAVLSVVSVTKMMDDYIQYRRRTASLQSGSLTKYTSSRNVLSRMLGDRDAQTITTADLGEMRDELLTMPAAYFRRGDLRACKTPRKNEKTISARTVSSHVNFLSSAYKWAIEEGRVVCTNPAAKCKVAQGESKQKLLPTVPEVLQLTSIPKKRHCNAYGLMEWNTIPKVLHYTGCRWAEVAGLHAADIVRQDGIWCLDINNRLRDLKTTDSSVRLIPIADAILPTMLNLRKKKAGHRLFVDVGDRQGGKKIGAGLNAKWNAAAKSVGDFSSHCFRVYVNNVFIRYGVDIIDRERLLGHKNRATQAVYTAKDLKRYKEHIELIAAHETKQLKENAAE